MAGHFFRVCEVASLAERAMMRGIVRDAVGTALAPWTAMEFLKSHPGLRSMDMEGRSLGTERPSVSTGAAHRGESFSDVLGARRVDGADDGVIDDVSRRIREGRTDAAEASEGGGDVNDGVAERPPEEAARSAEREFQTTPGQDDGNGSGDGPSDLETGETTDAIGPLRDGVPAEEAALAPVLNRATQPTAAGPVGSSSRGTTHGSAAAALQPPALVRPAVRAQNTGAPSAKGVAPVALPSTPQVAATGARAAQPIPLLGVERPGTRAPRAEMARTASPTRPDVAARAEAVLDTLRAHVRAGEREATIQLRPYDLGRIDMRVRVHGNRVRASIVAESRETLSVLEAHAPELRAWLAGDAGAGSGADGAEVQLDLALMDESNKDHAPWDELSNRQPGPARTPSNSASRSSQSAPSVQLRTSSPSPGGVDLVA